VAAVASAAAAAGSCFQPPSVSGSLVDDVAAGCGRVGGAVDGQGGAHVVMQCAILMTVQTAVRPVGCRRRLDGRDRRDALIAVTGAIAAATSAGIRVDGTGGLDLTAVAG